MYYELNVDNKIYKLRLTTFATVQLEKKLNCNPLSIFGDGETIPTVTTMVYILHAALQQYHHNVDINEAYNIFDTWLEDNHSMTDFIAVIIELYKVSGLIKIEKNEKN
jgi:hypothetical protein